MVRPRRISDFKPTFTNLAQTSHYQVFFAGLPLMLRQHLRVRGLNSRFVSETAGLLCNSALLPGSRLATADIVGNRMGVSEKMAHSRIFTQIQLEFYVDNEYKTLKFLEHWMEFIANGSTSRLNRQSSKDYYVRMEYPDTYKCDETKIVKFDRDYNEELEYKFIGLFPIDLTSTPVRYEQSEVLKATATFSFDRYLMGKYDSFSVARGREGNKSENEIEYNGLDNFFQDTRDSVISEGNQDGSSFMNAEEFLKWRGLDTRTDSLPNSTRGKS